MCGCRFLGQGARPQQWRAGQHEAWQWQVWHIESWSRTQGRRKVIGERCGNTEQWKAERGFGDGREKRVPVGAVLQAKVYYR